MSAVDALPAEALAPGRSCPLRYRYGPASLANASESAVQTLYVVGGLYGNRQALTALEALAARESIPPRLCFNGDFNWFNVDDAGFAAINRAVLRHDACLGNVEAEFEAADDAAGCGCAYPDHVDAGTVARSNAIHARLCATARRHPAILGDLAALPMLRRYRVGDVRIGVVHGDAEALAGWRFDVDALDNRANHGWLQQAFALAAVDVFASSHTCLPALRRCPGLPDRIVINNGAAGMPNLSGRRAGIVTRIGRSAPPCAPLYGTRLGDVRIDALPLDYDADAWERDFLANWPPESPAYVSYYGRIVAGPDHSLERARGVQPEPARDRSACENNEMRP